MHQLTLAEIARGLADKSFSSEELTGTLLARIKQLDPQLNSFISVTDELALGQARAADARRAAGETGRCRDYLANTLAEMAKLGDRDPLLEEVMTLIDAAQDAGA